MGAIKGEAADVYCYSESIPARHFYLLLHYICNGLFFLFSVCWLHVNEFNSLWEELRGEAADVYCFYIHSFRSQNTEKRNNAISQMRLRSGFKMRISILNTATTEQMGYGIISFFVCFLFNKSNELHHYQGLRFLFHLFGFLLHFLHHKGRSYHRRTHRCKVLSLRLLQLIPVVL